MNTAFNASTRTIVACLVAVTTLIACKPDQDETAASAPAAMQASTDSAGGMAGMPGMPGMSGSAETGGMMGAAMLDSLQAHMRSMADLSADDMKARLPLHRQMAANALSLMNTAMGSMEMSANTTWGPMVDSVRQDLARMPEMPAPDLHAMMPAHHRRMMRLMQMYGGMMESMK